jgi:SH3 domain-containing YSC84-like protein 1
MTKMKNFLFLMGVGALCVTAGDETAARVNKAADAFAKLSVGQHGIRPEQIAAADCIAVIPGFKKGAAVVGVGFGRGFISCRTGSGWSSPASIAFETGSVGIQLGAEQIDIVILSLDKSRRSKLLSERFTIGTDAAAAWGNGNAAHEDPNVQILFFGHTKGAFAGFGLDGSTIKADESGNKALYGKAITNTDVVNGSTDLPAIARPFVDRLSPETH